MSDTLKAVFLSYASQDAEAAKRICESLRAAGVEVWFDQSELRGGDAWDGKIRKQIRECALFMPVISSNTNARAEGYFRLEWKLAVDRSHLMADDAHFIFPVAVGGVTDATARVPDKFRDVQWSRLRLDETPVELAARVARLLGDGPATGPAATSVRGGSTASVHGSGQEKQPAWLRYAWALVGLTFALVFAVRPLWRVERSHEAPPAVAPSGASAEVMALCAGLRPDEWTRSDFDALTPTVDRLVSANPENSDVWALRGVANSVLVIRNLDSGTKPLEVGRDSAQRALRLAPNSPLAELSLGLHLTAMISRGSDVHAPRLHIERGLAGLPASYALCRYADLCSFWLGYQLEGAEKSARAWLAAEPGASFPAWILAQEFVARRQPDLAAKWAEQSAKDPDITGVRSFVTLFESRYYLEADLAAARAALDRVPGEQRGVHRVVASRFLLAMAEKHYDQALQELAQTPAAMLNDRVYHGPKALLAGFAQAAAGRPEAAQEQYRDSEKLLRDELSRDQDNFELRAVLALDLACLGRTDEARRELASVEPLLGGQEPSVYTRQPVALIAQAHGVMGEIDLMIPWLRRLFTEPSGMPFTPASLRLDPRFGPYAADARVQAFLTEFAGLDRPKSKPAALVAAPDAKSVAVLAFDNLSDDKANEYFSDGISEELLNALAKVPALKVAARTSSFYFKGQNVPVPEIAQKLGVAYLVEGSVRKAGHKVRITAELIKAADGFQVWSETYDRELQDIFAVQDEIAKNILQAVRGSLIGEADLPHATTTNIEAYTLFLQGQGAFSKRGEAGLREAIRLYDAALAIDPDYVPALVGLAQARVVLPNYAYMSGAKAQETIDAALKAARHALELDPENAAAFAVIGWAKFQFEWRWTESETALRHARDLAPNDSWNWNCLGDYYRFVVDLPKALVAKQREWDLDPLSPNSHWDLGYLQLVAGNYDQAIHWSDLCIGLAPHNVDSYMPGILAAARSGRFELMHQTFAAARRNVHEGEGMMLLLEANCAILEKKPDEARRLLALAAPLAEAASASPGYLGYCYLLLGDSDQASAWLQKGYDRHDPSLVWNEVIDFEVIATNPKTRPLLDRPGIKELYELRQRNARAGLNKL